MRVTEILPRLEVSIAESEAEIEAQEERLSIQCAELDDALTTTERAINSLDRPERFNGEHDVARAWLENHADPIEWRVFRRKAAS